MFTQIYIFFFRFLQFFRVKKCCYTDIFIQFGPTGNQISPPPLSIPGMHLPAPPALQVTSGSFYLFQLRTYSLIKDIPKCPFIDRNIYGKLKCKMKMMSSIELCNENSYNLSYRGYMFVIIKKQDYNMNPIKSLRSISLKQQADAELQPSSVRGGEDFTADFTFVHDYFFKNFQ